MTGVEERVKVFLEAWNLRDGKLDKAALCQVCGQEIVDGNFAMIDGKLICLKCREKNGTE